MMVPRAFRYTTAPPTLDFDEKGTRRTVQKSVTPQPQGKLATRPTSPARTRTEPSRVATPAIEVPVPERRNTAAVPQAMPRTQRRVTKSRDNSGTPHDPNALPPAVAALLAVTQIPRPKPNQFRRRPATSRRISIDELVSEWKSEESVAASYSSSPALSMLLEDCDDTEVDAEAQKGTSEEQSLHTRSTSLESVPSLDDDSRSIVSSGSLKTPESLRSRRSISNLRKEKMHSLPSSVDCVTSHPLAASPVENDEQDLDLEMNMTSSSRSSTPRPRTSFKSNLTTSFQALKKVAISSISSFSVSSVSPAQRSASSPLSDDMLWSHPFLFPRFSPEVRPTIEGTPTKAQRRYLNPIPLTFEEQEAPYQLALHAPFLAEHNDRAPYIQLQTYNRGKRKSGAKRGAGPDPQSEAGRALSAASAVRQREPRENSDFLRVVVLEMNMRRSGKLEHGRAKIWLPPRQTSLGSEDGEGVPKRWVGESAY